MKPHRIILICFLIAGAALRFFQLGESSLTNDELSALSRLQFDTFGALIESGVRPDFHPAGVQLFLYWWTELFGTSPFAVRFPFALAGILAIIPAYLIGRNWFGITTGLMTAALVAFGEFPLLYSQLARPYSPGLLFSLMLVYHWSGFWNNQTGTVIRKIDIAGYVLFTVLCMYTHYFSFLFAIITGLAGLILIRKNLAVYLLAAVLSVLLFLPHLGISMEQFGRGGLASWLGPPDSDSLLSYVNYIFNQSWWLFLFAVVATIAGAQSGMPGIGRKRMIAISLFFIPWFIAHFYSVWVNPVFQYSILLFSFPFLLLFVFSWMAGKPGKIQLILVILFALITLISTVVINRYYRGGYFGEFKALAQHIAEWNNAYGEDKITHSTNVNGPYYIHYYLEDSVEFVSYELENHGTSLAKLDSIAKHSNTPYFSHSWSTRFDPYERDQIIRKHYPTVVSRQDYFNSGITLYSRQPTAIGEAKPDLFAREISMDNSWIELNKDSQYSPELRMPVEEIFADTGGHFLFESTLLLTEGAEVSLVASFERNGETLHWYGLDIESFWKSPEDTLQAFIIRKTPDDLRKGDILKMFVWLRNDGRAQIGNLRVRVHDDWQYPY